MASALEPLQEREREWKAWAKDKIIGVKLVRSDVMGRGHEMDYERCRLSDPDAITYGQALEALEKWSKHEIPTPTYLKYQEAYRVPEDPCIRARELSIHHEQKRDFDHQESRQYHQAKNLEEGMDRARGIYEKEFEEYLRTQKTGRAR